jgi:hypothetical protein
MQRHASHAFSFALSLAAACTLSLSACPNPGSPQTNKPIIDIKERPDPQRAYRIVMTIDNAPGPFGMIEGAAQYDVINHNECGYIDAGTETISRINTHPPIEWKPVDEGQYEVTVYADLMLDEDYYGRGMCRWKLTAASALMRATGAETETRFMPGISTEKITAGTPLTLHFASMRYPRSGMDDFADFGEAEPYKYKPEIRDQLFTITMTPKDAQP